MTAKAINHFIAKNQTKRGWFGEDIRAREKAVACADAEYHEDVSGKDQLGCLIPERSSVD